MLVYQWIKSLVSPFFIFHCGRHLHFLVYRYDLYLNVVISRKRLYFTEPLNVVYYVWTVLYKSLNERYRIFFWLSVKFVAHVEPKRKNRESVNRTITGKGWKWWRRWHVMNGNENCLCLTWVLFCITRLVWYFVV